jgi:hypothetical protein
MGVRAIKANKRADIEVVERQIKRLVDVILAGADALRVNAKLKELDAAKSRLVGQLEVIPEDRPLLHPALAVTYRDSVAALASALFDDQSRCGRHSQDAFGVLNSAKSGSDGTHPPLLLLPPKIAHYATEK